jgi:hypothetical protein
MVTMIMLYLANAAIEIFYKQIKHILLQESQNENIFDAENLNVFNK